MPPDPGTSGLGGLGVEILLILVGALVTGVVTYYVTSRLKSREAVVSAEARKHQAQLDQEARESERNEEDRRRLVDTVKALYVELQTLGAKCAQWSNPETMAEIRAKWAEDLRPRVVDLSLMPQAGNRRAQKIAERLLREYEDLTHQAYLLSRQGDNHPHGAYTYNRYNLAQGETEFLLKLLLESVGGEKAPSREDWGPELRHRDDWRDERDFSD